MKIERFEVNPFQENCFVVSDETGEGIIIDCGVFFKEERRALVNYIKDNGISLKHLVATHGHIDHNFGNNTICEEFGLKPEIYHKDEYLMNKLNKQAVEFCNYDLGYEMPPVGKYLNDEDKITFGNHSFSVIPTPGHTPGSIFLYCEQEQLAFSGDTLFKMSIGRTDFELGSYNDIKASLQKIAKMLPPDTTILPGHGPKTTLGYEMQYNPYMK